MIAVFLAVAVLLGPTDQAPLKTMTPPPPAAGEKSAPVGAVLAGVAVTLECTARASGRVEGCKVLEETHPGLGFGEAAIALMRDAEVPSGPRDIQFARTILFTP